MISKLNKLLAGINLGLMAGMVAMGIYLYFKVLPGRNEKIIYETQVIEIPFPLVEKKGVKRTKKVESPPQENASAVSSNASMEEPPPPIPINPEGETPKAVTSVKEKLTIHVGDFSSKSEAEKAVSLVKSLGLEPRIKKQESSMVLTRVMAGPFKSRKELLSAKKKILSVFPKVFLVKRKEGYYIHVGSFSKKEEVEKARSAILKLGFKAKTEEVTIKKFVFSVDAGVFKGFKEAEPYIEKFKKRGYDVFVVPLKNHGGASSKG